MDKNTIEAQMQIVTLLQERSELLKEMESVAEVLSGFHEVSGIVYYNRKDGQGLDSKTIFQLKNFPFNLKTELKILLSDALDQYSERLNEIDITLNNL